MSLTALMIALTLGMLAILIHYEVIRRIVKLYNTYHPRPHLQIVLTIIILFFAHVIEVWMFAVSYYGIEHWLDLGFIDGQKTNHFDDYLYFSAATYTTLGYGDLYPHGAIRLIAGSQALIGLILITWSGSFTYLMMHDLWNRFKKEMKE